MAGRLAASAAAASRTTAAAASTTRRRLLLPSLLLPSLLSLDAGLLDETAPEIGDCPTCVAGSSRSGTLGACAGAACVSSFDDRPDHFVAPWEFDGPAAAAFKKLKSTVAALGGEIAAEEAPGYLYATFSGGVGGADDVEFLLTPGDTTVSLAAVWDGRGRAGQGCARATAPRHTCPTAAQLALGPPQVQLRAAARRRGVPDFGRNARRLEELRRATGFGTVPILRNRQRALIFGESPFDTFGPTPPPDAASSEYGSADLLRGGAED